MRPAALCFLGLPLLCASGAPAPVILRYQFRPGEVLSYRTAFEQRLVLHNPKGQLGNLDVHTRYLLDLAHRVTAVGPGPVYEIEATPKSVEVQIEGPMAKSAGQIAEMLRKAGFALSVDAQGRVKSLAETKATPDALKKVVASLKNALGQLLPMLPEAAQRPGGSWRQQLPLPIDLPTGDKLQATLTVDYVLRGYARVRGRPCADLGIRMHLGLGGAMGQARGRVTVSGHGSGHGFAYLDLERGVLVASGAALVTESHFQSATVEVRQRSESQMRMVLVP